MLQLCHTSCFMKGKLLIFTIHCVFACVHDVGCCSFCWINKASRPAVHQRRTTCTTHDLQASLMNSYKLSHDFHSTFTRLQFIYFHDYLLRVEQLSFVHENLSWKYKKIVNKIIKLALLKVFTRFDAIKNSLKVKFESFYESSTRMTLDNETMATERILNKKK